MKENPFFYGWVIVGLTVVNLILIYGIRHSFAVFFSPILDEFGWSRGNISIMLSLNIFIYGFLAPWASVLADRLRPRRVILVGVTILGTATAGCALAKELWHFYFFFGLVMPMGTALSGWPILGPALMNWFESKRGLVVGLAQMGGGLSFVYTLFIELLILDLGWRNTFLVLAGVLIAVLFPANLFFFYYRSRDKGLKPYSLPVPQTPPISGARDLIQETTEFHQWTLGRVLRAHQLWFLVLSYALYWGLGIYLVLAHQVRFTEDAGFSGLFSASIFALFGVALFTGQFSGFLADWMGREKAGTLATILSICALLALISVRDTSQPWLLYVYSICFGLGNGLFTPAIFAGSADIFRGRYFGVVSGLLLTGMGTGGAIGPWLGGYLFDISGSYINAFLFCILCLGLACICLWIAAPRKVHEMKVRN